MINTVARFVTRLQGEGDGLFIGSLLKSGQGVLKPNTVYEIRDVMGALTIVEIGQGIGAGSDNCVSNMMAEGKTPFHWGSDIGHTLVCFGKIMFLTYEEYQEHCKRSWETYHGQIED